MEAVIYCRVSTKEQVSNMSLPHQRKQCAEYCARNGYAVARVFVDEGESAKTSDRPELQNMLAYCRENKRRVKAVVVYALSRFAREKSSHFLMRAALGALGITLRSVTEPIDDSATGKFMEGVLSAAAQYENDVKADRTKSGMREALSRGRWTFVAPIGYQNAPGRAGLMPDPASAALVRHAFELVASGKSRRKPCESSRPVGCGRVAASGCRLRRSGRC